MITFPAAASNDGPIGEQITKWYLFEYYLGVDYKKQPNQIIFYWLWIVRSVYPISIVPWDAPSSCWGQLTAKLSHNIILPPTENTN